MLRISGLVGESIVDGPGFRYVVFTQGCKWGCMGCHNPQTHDLKGGYEITVEEIIEKIKKNPLLDGVTISGGEPFLQADECTKLAKLCKEDGLNVITYTGYMWEELMEKEEFFSLIELSDIIIDGRFEMDKKSLECKFRGSVNQRIIDVKPSLKNGKVVLYHE